MGALVVVLGMAVMSVMAVDAWAGDREEAIIAGCATSSPDGTTMLYCTAAGLAGMEVKQCLDSAFKDCLGKNNEIRKALCQLGVGCSKRKEDITVPRWVLPYKDGCIAAFKHGTYYSPDCDNLRGGGRTVAAWPGKEHDILGMVVFKDCVISAFAGGGIYRSCNGINLGGGGETKVVYSGRPIHGMTVKDGKLVTTFKSSKGIGSYCDPTGLNPGGGGQTVNC